MIEQRDLERRLQRELLCLCGAVLWASFWALGVYYLDLHFEAVVTALRQLNPWIAGLTIIGVIALLLFVLIAIIRRWSRTKVD